MTLIEVIAGIAILMVVAIPLLNMYTKIGSSSKVNDLRIAYALMRGETEKMYKTHTVSMAEQSVNIEGTSYSLTCTIESRNGDMVSWTMKTRKGRKTVAILNGLLYSPQ